MISLLFALATTATAADIPLRDFFKNPEKNGFKLSDDGEWIAFMAQHKGRKNIFVQKRGAKEAKPVTEETARDIAGYFWKGNDTLLYVKDFGGDENFHVVSVSRDGTNAKDLTPFPKVRAGIVDALPDQKDVVLVSHNKRNAEVFDVYRLNVKTGALDLVAENPGGVTDWVTDHAGDVRVAIKADGVSTSVLFRETTKAPWKTVLTTSFKESLAPQFFTFDNKKLYVASNIGRDKQAIAIWDPATAKEEKVIFSHPDNDVEHLDFSRARKVITCAQFTTWKEERECFDPATKELLAELEKKLPGYQVDIVAHDKSEQKVIVATSSDKTNGARYFYDVKTKGLEKLADVTPWLDEKLMSDMKPITYQSRDGLTIHGYLTLPKGSSGKNLPLVVNPHGGPWARDDWYFSREVQFLASRGYAVLQMNFRGSTGYGRKFWEASFKQWGKKMQDDVTDGVKYVIKEGIADPKRIAIYGGSYGGYTTLAGLAYTPDLYACGVDYVGVANMFTFMTTIPPYWEPMRKMFYEMVGDPEKDKALLTEVSPALNADKIKAPLFIAQGKNDPRVNVAESDQMVAALKKRGIEVPYMVKDNEGHGFRNEENRFDFYGEMEKFLAKHIGQAKKG